MLAIYAPPDGVILSISGPEIINSRGDEAALNIKGIH